MPEADSSNATADLDGKRVVDVARQKFVVFGGTNDNSTWLGDTWEFDLTAGTWADVTPGTSPSARRWCAMSYDAVRGECVLYGGVNQAGVLTSP